jgi:hypothetical protein
MEPAVVFWLILGAIVIVVIVALSMKKKSGYMYLPARIPQVEHHWQNEPPGLPLENRYHHCVLNECGADYDNYECMQRCYIKAAKNGTEDHADLVCRDRANTENEYYQCLDAVYGNYKYMDRGLGTMGPAACPAGESGYLLEDGSSLCHPKYAPLNDRNVRLSDGDIYEPEPSRND